MAPSTYYAAKSREPSARATRDAALLVVLTALHAANFSVYGARKMWKAMVRAGHDVGRDQVARLMRQAGLRGVRRMIVGWRVAAHMRTEMVLDALEMARWQRGTEFEGLILHSDAGSQMTSIRYGERVDEIGARPSIGSVGDAFDNALAESVNALYKTELVRGPGRGPWRTIDDLELATLGWVHWHNHERLHSYLDDVPPIEFEMVYAAEISSPELIEITA